MKLDIKQKSVDMKFGLDMANMATKHSVDKIVLIAQAIPISLRSLNLRAKRGA